MSTNPTPVELKPCPFAHEVKRGINVRVDDEEFGIAQAFCGDCGSYGPFIDLSDHPTHKAAQLAAIAAWNARTRPPASAAPVDAFAEAVRLLEAEWYEDGELATWLNAPHPQFDGLSAIQMLAAGRKAEVLACVRRLDEGVYL